MITLLVEQNTIALISGLATLLTAIATLAMVLEMRKQRLAAQRPDVVVKNVPYGVLYFESLHPVPYTFYIGKDRTGIISETRLFCTNLGFGVAKDLLFEWEVDYLSILAAIAQNEDWEVRGGDDPAEAVFHHGDEQLHVYYGSNLSRGEVGSLPVGGDGVIIFPSGYVNLLLISLYVYRATGIGRGIDIAAPPIRLKLTYRDSNKHQHTKYYDARITSIIPYNDIASGLPPNDRECLMFGDLIFSEL